MSPVLMKATVFPSAENVGCVPPTSASEKGKEPSLSATEIPVPSLYAISAVKGSDQDGSLAPVRSVALPVPSGLIVQMFAPQVYPIEPFRARERAALRRRQQHESSRNDGKPDQTPQNRALHPGVVSGDIHAR